MARGGKREGAGRKPQGEEKRVTISVMVDVATRDKIKRLKSKGWTLGRAIDEMISKIEEQ